MRLLTVAAIVWLARWQVCAYGSRALVPRTTTIPAPISIPPSQHWEGNDGPWSTFALQVGTPAQDVRVLISTADSKTWVVLPIGCPQTLLPDCPGIRGGTYDNSTSTTWSQRGFFNLGVEENLGIDFTTMFGNDTITLGVQGSGGPTLENQLLGGIANGSFWIGEFGVNPKRTNFSDTRYSGQLDNGQASYMTGLKERNMIPSLSFGYTAGAQYQLKGVFGSLTLGGYDASRFTSNDLSFTFAPDNSRDLVVGIQSITSTEKNGKSYDLLPSGILAYVDSTIPYIYLPAEACRAFEEAFNLTYDSTNSLYPVTSTLRTALLARNASITFTLGDSKSGGSVINITLPYASFDLMASYPAYPNSTRYFPLKQANETQYALGRAFLQEAYLIVDWERSNFSISQCTFDENMKEELVPIQALSTPSNSTSTGGQGGSVNGNSSGNGKTIGIAVGVVIVVLILIGGLATFLLMRRRKRAKVAAEAAALASTNHQAAQSEHGFGKTELDTDNEHTRHELSAPGVAKHEAVSQGQDPNPTPEPNDHILPAELRGEGQNVAELGSHHGPAPHYELYDPSAAPVELPADSYPELHGSTPSASGPSSMTSTPVMRSTTGSLINRSLGSSPVYRPLGGGGRSPSNRPARPPFQTRISTMDTLASDTPSLPSQPSGMSGPAQGPAAASPLGNDTLNPNSPVAEGTLRQGGLLSYTRGMGSSNAQSDTQSHSKGAEGGGTSRGRDGSR